MNEGGKMPDSPLQELQSRNQSLETQVKHLSNDLDLTKQEYEKTLQNYFDLYSDLAIRSQELKKLKEQSERRSRELQTMLDASPAMIYYKNTHLRFIRVNRLFSETLCRSASEIIGNTYEELFPDKQDHGLQDDVAVIQNNHPILKKSMVLETDIDRRELVVDKYPYLDADGSVIGVITFALDLTDLRKVQQHKQQIDVHNLRKMNGEATITLVNNLMLHFNSALEAILCNTNSMAEKLAGEHTISPFIQSNLTVVKEIQNTLGSTVKYASPENYAFARNNLFTTLEKSLVRLREHPLYNQNRIEIQTNGNRDIAFDFDREKMAKLFYNLGASALSMFPEDSEGMIEMHLSRKKIDTSQSVQLYPGDYAVVSISDTSDGTVSSHYSTKLHSIFSEQWEDEQPNDKLLQAYWILRNHHGNIKIQDTKTPKNTFNLYIPVFLSGSDHL